MPKRKQPSTVKDDLERLYKKIKKLEKKISSGEDTSRQPAPPSDYNLDESGSEDQRPQRYEQSPPSPAPLSPSSPPESEFIDDAPPPPPDPSYSDNADEEPLLIEEDVNVSPPVNEKCDDRQLLAPEPLPEKTSTGGLDTCLPADEPPTDKDLDEDVLAILGDDPSSSTKYGPEIRKELASRFQHIATEGLSKDTRKELISKYLIPANCLHVGAPTVNPEIKAALNDTVAKRDKGIETKQKEMASAIACLTDIISTHLLSKEKNNEVLQKLMDVGRILCDIQHGDSVTRRNFILFSVKNDMQEHLKSTKIDTSLFGEKLSETLKSAKAVNKSGAELKVNLNKNQSKKTRPPATHTLNRKAAPQRRPPGAAQANRSREPAQTRAFPPPPPPPPPAPAPAYRTSLPQPPPPAMRRRY